MVAYSLKVKVTILKQSLEQTEMLTELFQPSICLYCINIHYSRINNEFEINVKHPLNHTWQPREHVHSYEPIVLMQSAFELQ